MHEHGFINNLVGPRELTPERWEQVSRIFKSAIELNAAEREVYLQNECGPDESLRHEVAKLIQSHQKASAENFINASPFTSDSEGSERTLSEGQELGPYQVIKHLGTGGMGEVYLAKDTRLERRVALKVLSSELARDKRRMQRFQQEARMASSLNQPNILTVFEFGEVDSHNFLATEYIDGETLRHHLREEPLRLAEILEISMQILAALDAAHEANIVHRDIKPENVMLRQRDRIVKVLDFGLAKATEKVSATHGTDSEIATQFKTAAGTILGTVNYMSPEQAQGLPVDERTDLWSTGVIIYEMVTGEAPFKGPTSSHTIVQILENEPPPLTREGRFAVPAELQRIVSKALAKRTDERYQTAKDMLIDLRKLSKQLDVEVEMRRSVGPVQAEPQNRNPIAATATSESEVSSWSGKKTISILAIVVGLAVLTIGTLWGLNAWRGAHSTPGSSTPAPAIQRALTYSITVQKYRDNRPFEGPFQLAKEMLFERDYQIRLNISSPQSGFLYILNEGPHDKGNPAEFVVLFPSPTSNSSSALITENHQIQIPEKSWIHFDSEKGTERVWLIFAANAIPELEPIRTFASPKTQGLITDSSLRDTVTTFLRTHAENKAATQQNVDRKETTLTSRGEILIYPIDLEHQ